MMMGQSVPFGKDNLSRDLGSFVRHIAAMGEWLDEGDFNGALARRLKDLRGKRTQAEMAAALDLPTERYKKYETRSPLPAYLVPRLAKVTGHSMAYVIAGTEDAARGPSLPNEDTLAKLLYSLGPALPDDGMTEQAARALTAALRRGFELLPDDPSESPTDTEFARAARGAMSQFREASQP